MDIIRGFGGTSFCNCDENLTESLSSLRLDSSFSHSLASAPGKEVLSSEIENQMKRIDAVFRALSSIYENGIVSIIVLYDQNPCDCIISDIQKGNEISKVANNIARFVTMLDLSGYQEEIGSISKIFGYFKNLKALTMPRSVTGSCNTTLAQLENLESLDLTFSNTTDATLALISRFETLNSLDLTWSKDITDKGISLLKNFTALRTLNLSWCDQITDIGLASIAHLAALEVLDLFCCSKITDSGLALLVSLTSLKSLDLSGCKNITDDGLIKLAELKNLRKLLVTYCENITTAGIARAKKNNPLLEIYRFT